MLSGVALFAVYYYDNCYAFVGLNCGYVHWITDPVDLIMSMVWSQILLTTA